MSAEATQDAAAGPDALAAAFRSAMGGLASGVVLVTTWADGRPWGLTISSCTSVSVDPPTLLVSLGSQTRSARDIEATGRFGIGILGDRLVEVAQIGSAPGRPKWVDEHCEGDPGAPVRSPVLRGALAHFDCRVVQALPFADHTIFLGAVEDVVTGEDAGSSLVYFRRRYWQVASFAGTDRLYEHW